MKSCATDCSIKSHRNKQTEDPFHSSEITFKIVMELLTKSKIEAPTYQHKIQDTSQLHAMKFNFSVYLLIMALTKAEEDSGNIVKMCLFYPNPSGHARTDPILSQSCPSDHVHTVRHFNIALSDIIRSLISSDDYNLCR